MSQSLFGAADLTGLPFVTYARQSDRREDGSAASPVAQKERAISTGEGRGMVHAGHYADLGISGWNPHVVRPDFDRMMRDAAAGKFKAVVVLALSRLTRKGARDALEIHDRLKKCDVVLISVSEPFLDTSSPLGVALFALVAALAEQESENKSVFIAEAKQEIKKAGGFVGGHVGYGLRAKWVTQGEGGDAIRLRIFEPHPEEGPVLASVADGILGDGRGKNGKSLRSEAERLNREGVPTRNPRGKEEGSRWHPGGLRRMLRDPRLAGYSAVPEGARNPGRRKVTYRYVIQRDADGNPIKSHESIIEPAKWWELQEVLDMRAGHSGGTGSLKLLSGIDTLFCSCGWRMSSGGPTRYQCRRPRGTMEAHSANVIQEALLDEHIARRLMARLTSLDEADPDDLGLLAAATRRWADTVDNPENARERSELRAELSALDDAESELYEARREGLYGGKVGRAEFLKDKATIEASRKTLETKLSALNEEESAGIPLSVWTVHDGDPIGEGSWWASASLEDKQEIIKLFVRRVVIKERPVNASGQPMGGKYDPAERVEIHWRRPDAEKEENTAGGNNVIARAELAASGIDVESMEGTPSLEELEASGVQALHLDDEKA
ncbi:DNA invertase Pin-like site-specific DNA recombinase [Nocardiopsis mwathae]|uniref:DNA invertase Pin-like site-specific DNA recombinase n=1 Tax=Nocardiopsis mwathae TaxID=1472723 RepID=A0A7W9YKC0_9ACTN|nr:recombinase family protein [Nocardiopsis mwathae]MBB6173116.1 DNA invertase Pin-like site-specific DNA recombinase [Nocardiopsis mwathae]